MECWDEALVCWEKKPPFSIKKTSWQRLLYVRHCSVAFTVVWFLFFLWASNRKWFPSHFVWMVSLIIIMVSRFQNRHRARRMCMHDMNKHKHTNRLSSLCYDSFCRTYRTALGTWRWTTPASPLSSSLDRSTKHLNNTTQHCTTQRSNALLHLGLESFWWGQIDTHRNVLAGSTKYFQKTRCCLF